jgi:hypothetical protein
MTELLDRRFWGQFDAKWPVDSRELIFIARAVHAVGRTLYGQEWSDEDPLAEAEFDQGDRYFVHSLHSAWETQKRTEPVRWPDVPDAKVVSDVIATNNAAAARVRRTCDWIAAAARNGDIVTRLRPVSGGISEQPKDGFWFTDDYLRLFHQGQCSVANTTYFSPSVGKYFIYFARDTFDTAIERLRSGAEAFAPPLETAGDGKPSAEGGMTFPPTDRSGVAGRPTSMHLIEQMMESRFDAGEQRAGIGAESKELAALFAAREDCRSLHRPAPRTIENRLRAKFNALAASARNKAI